MSLKGFDGGDDPDFRVQSDSRRIYEFVETLPKLKLRFEPDVEGVEYIEVDYGDEDVVRETMSDIFEYRDGLPEWGAEVYVSETEGREDKTIMIEAFVEFGPGNFLGANRPIELMPGELYLEGWFKRVGDFNADWLKSYLEG